MPTAIEQAYVDQGYVLPAGVTWAMVHDHRATYDIGEIYVPVCTTHGVTAWGVPIINGEFMKRPA